MRAIVFHEVGLPTDVLRLEGITIPEMRDNEVLVKMSCPQSIQAIFSSFRTCTRTRAFRGEVSHLAIMDAPIPGTGVLERVKANPCVWHFDFRNARDIAELLVSGPERQFLQALSMHEYSMHPR